MFSLAKIMKPVLGLVAGLTMLSAAVDLLPPKKPVLCL